MAKKICSKCGLLIDGKTYPINGIDYCLDCSIKVFSENIEKEYPTSERKLVGIIELLDVINVSIQRQENQINSLKSNLTVITVIMIISFIVGFF